MNWKNILYPKKVINALRIETKALKLVGTHGKPNAILHFLGGIGDELLLTCVAHELKKRKYNNIWQISSAAPLLENNPDYSLVLNTDYWPLRHSNYLNQFRINLSYSKEILKGEYELPPRQHILATICRKSGIRGTIKIRPWVILSEEEQKQGKFADRQIVIHSLGKSTHETWMKNKSWYHDRYQSVVNLIKYAWPEIEIIQVGIKEDPPLNGVTDLRGMTGLRELALVINQADCLISCSGFFTHLARAVDTRSVIIYGGREHAWQSGYICNENIESHLPCSPCWLWNDCDYHRKCMDMIQPEMVVERIEKVLNNNLNDLETEEIVISDEISEDMPTYPQIPGSRKIENLPPFLY